MPMYQAKEKLIQSSAVSFWHYSILPAEVRIEIFYPLGPRSDVILTNSCQEYDRWRSVARYDSYSSLFLLSPNIIMH